MRGFPIMALLILVSSAAIAQTPAAPTAPPPSPALVAPAPPPAPPAPSVPTPPPAMAPAPAAAPAATAPDGITRDEYIAKARDEAAKRAGDRFDAMDTNHDGVLTKEEIAAYRAAHARKKAAPEPQ